MQKWSVVRVYCDFLPTSHDKFCICICPTNRWFFFINSELPQFRKARELAISIENYEAAFLNHTSYVDTTKIVNISQELIDIATADPDRDHGLLPPSLQTRIAEAVESHEVLTDEQRQKILE